MRLSTVFIGFGLVFLTSLAVSRVSAQTRQTGPEFINVYLVEGSGYLPKDLEKMVTHARGSLLTTHPEINLAIVQSDEPKFASQIIGYPGVSRATRDVRVRWIPDAETFDSSKVVQSTGDVPGRNPIDAAFFGACQWNLEIINLREALEKDRPGDDSVVAVLDTGIDPFHQDLVGRIDLANSASALTDPFCDLLFGIPDTRTVFDFNFHGTVVSSMVTSNGIGIAAVAPHSTIVGIKVLACDGFGSFGDLISGIMYAATLPHVEVINMSLGELFPRDLPGIESLTALVAAAIDFATDQGKLVVAAAGNEGLNLDSRSDLILLPSQASNNVASISATTIEDRLASYSNHGLSGALVAAPGGDLPNPLAELPGCPIALESQSGIIGACSQFSIFIPECQTADDFYVLEFIGTSASSGHAAGVAALANAAGEDLSPSKLREVLVDSADDLGPDGPDPIFSNGRINAGEAVEDDRDDRGRDEDDDSEDDDDRGRDEDDDSEDDDDRDND